MARVTRLDLTAMYDLGNGKRVLAWLRAASDSATMQYRGRGQFAGDTLYWGKIHGGGLLRCIPRVRNLKHISQNQLWLIILRICNQ